MDEFMWALMMSLVVLFLVAQWWWEAFRWLLLVAFPLCLLATWLIFLAGGDTPPPDRTAQDAPASAPKLSFRQPTVGKNHVYELDEIRWCLREEMILDKAAGEIDSQRAVERYNERAAAYNRLCATFRYRDIDMGRAQRQIASRREAILAADHGFRKGRHSADDRSRTLAHVTPAAVSPGRRLHGHGPPGDEALLCGRVQSKPLTAGEAQSVYRWTDEKGVTHFSQRGGAGAEYVGDRYKKQQRLFDLTVSFSQGRNDPVTKDAVHRSAHQVYDTLKGLIEPQRWRRVELDVLLHENRDDFRRELRRRDLGDQVGAFFSTKENRVHMRLDLKNRERMLSVARHEISHALLASLVGSTPAWLNEGLAEYMEKGAHDPAPLGKTRLRGPAELNRLLAMSQKRFYGSDGVMNYLEAYMLVRHLMGHTQGKQAISHFLNRMAANPCSPLDSPAIMGRAYAGGIEGLARSMGLPGTG